MQLFTDVGLATLVVTAPLILAKLTGGRFQ
jgi:hypothetical protein